jgi:lipopolysaccharide/colanic/teichoic acid biosynthesis glycosyltransferase
MRRTHRAPDETDPPPATPRRVDGTGALGPNSLGPAPGQLMRVYGASSPAQSDPRTTPRSSGFGLPTAELPTPVPARSRARRGKRLFDLALVLLTAPITAPLALLVAAANLAAFGRLDRVLFTQPRVGHEGRVFRILKFRTMREAQGSSFDSWAAGGDGLRVTALGRFLRNSHLDELPQLLNVLRGEMSIVGPRPEMVEVERWAEGELPGFGRRLAIPPGITGLAQVVQGYTAPCAWTSGSFGAPRSRCSSSRAGAGRTSEGHRHRFQSTAPDPRPLAARDQNSIRNRTPAIV